MEKCSTCGGTGRIRITPNPECANCMGEGTVTSKHPSGDPERSQTRKCGCAAASNCEICGGRGWIKAPAAP